jgi:SAM-dependent methyltransferase
MNDNHAALCSSPEWASFLESHVLEPLGSEVDLGADMVEFGPGPGAATAWLRQRVTTLTAIEVDPAAAARLADVYAGTNVTVLVGDSTRTDLPSDWFDSVATFTMLHHLPTQAMQFAVLGEGFRVLRPGGVLIGSDSLASTELHDFHEGDVYNPIDPARLLVYLQACGYRRISLLLDENMLFTAHKPSPDGHGRTACESRADTQ